jgi:predicted N-formylglutamate amidohydrolase
VTTILVSPADPPPFRSVNPNGAAPVILLCDHAANAIPRKFGSLGLTAAELDRHIAWDIGAEKLTCQLAGRLDAPAILSSFSRLVIDCNRAPDSPASIAEDSDGTLVIGNIELTREEREARAQEIFWPYHRRIAATLDECAERHVVPAVLSIHSFTPCMNGVARPWPIGVLWDKDARIAKSLIRALSDREGLLIGDNEPYSLRGPTDFTLPYHAVSRNLAHTLIEVRQDEIANEAGVLRVADILERALATVLADPELR